MVPEIKESFTLFSSSFLLPSNIEIVFELFMAQKVEISLEFGFHQTASWLNVF
jgi:hypothetical protein